MKSARGVRKSASRGILVGPIGDAIAHPWRSLLAGLLGIALAWIVISTSLADALAPRQPDWALSLSPEHPVALLAKAEELRARLVTLVSSDAGQGDGPKATEPPARPETAPVATANAASVGAITVFAERQLVRREIALLAKRTIASDPLNARAFRLLAEVTDDHDAVRRLMQEAVKRSRRETAAVFWLLNDSFVRRDFAAALQHADVLLRTRPELNTYTLKYLAQIAEDPDGQPLLVKALEAVPAWRGHFFEAVASNVSDVAAPHRILEALQSSPAPPSLDETRAYLAFLVSKNMADFAYNVWLQFRPHDTSGRAVDLITNPSFETKPTGVPFDWRIGQSLNAVAEFVGRRDRTGEHALHISFGTGRVRFPEVSQVVFLPAGSYVLEGKLMGTIVAKRGLRWQLQCLYGARAVVGETDMVQGMVPAWRDFRFEANVPLSDDCRLQMLRLFHDARSASEELITGEIWFDDLRIVQLRR